MTDEKETVRDVYPSDPFRSYVFRCASTLRSQLEAANGLKYQKKGPAKRAVKRDALKLLIECVVELNIAWPLMQLFADILDVKINQYEWPQEKFEAVKTEASFPKPKPGDKRISPMRLATMLKKQTRKKIDPTQIKRWRKDPEYEYLVHVRREPNLTPSS